MFWTSLFWTSLFWTGPTSLYTVTPYDFEYNWYEFWWTSTKFKLENIPNFEEANAIQIQTYDRALNNWAWMNWYYIKPKVLKILWTLYADTASELEDRIDELKYYVLQKQKTLRRTKPNWVVVEWTASCSKFEPNRQPYHITFMPVMIEFIVLDWFLYDTTVNEYSSFANTADFTWTLTVSWWNYEVEPILYFTFNSATSVTSLSITINNQTMTFNKTFSAWDMLIVDCINTNVTYNSVSWQNYLWEFFVLPVWWSVYDVSVTWSAFNIDLAVQWYNTYV